MKKGNKTRKLLGSVLEYVISIGVFVLAWLIYTTVKDVPLYILPSPVEVGKSLIEMFADGTVYPHLWATTYEVIIGFIIGSVLGMALGYLFIKVDVLRTALMPYLIFFQTAPKIALVPLFVVWFGIGIVSKIILIITMVLFPVLSGMMLGLDSIPKEAKDLMKVLKASKWQIFTKITLPLSKPIIVYTVLTAFMAPWLDFIFAKVICRANSDQYTVAIGLWKMLEKEYIDSWYTSFAAGAVLISIPIAILFLYMQRYYVDGVSGAVKG